ncbi:AAA family ATPase [Limosilactobacillus pontis]|uniref:AAA family ATPase n=1 Tax=Limosilactobacillus pontis TaxID=35787 RepID=A0ABT7UY96_9LACO|nr:UvrD-helicase domain-containing protein [Limosilactobacillus pontis]MDM8266682.1 AAA family ATPase [Limosilactobacillus pontis]
MELTPLAGEQVKILELPDDRYNYTILGAAGTGKSLIALHRALQLQRNHPGENIVFITFNRFISQKLNMSSNLNVRTFHSFARRIVKDYIEDTQGPMDQSRFNYVNSYKRKDLLKEATDAVQQENPDSGFWTKNQFTDDFISDEINWIEENLILNVDQYINASRTGRGRTRINDPADRRIIYAIFEKYLDLINQEGRFYDFENISWKLLDVAQRSQRPMIDYLIIDEFQNLTKADLIALAHMTVDEPGRIMLFGDVAQQLFGRRFSWRELGINNERKQTIQKVYRNTKQISSLASSIFENNPIDEGDEAADVVSAIDSVREGPMPQLIHTPQISDIVNRLATVGNNLADYGTTLVIINNYRDRQTVVSALNERGIATHTSNNFEDYDPQRQLFICSTNQLVGLEFDTVIFAGIDNQTDPRDSDAFRTFIHSIYIGLTRARQNLLMYYMDPTKLGFLQGSQQYYQVRG